MNQVEIIAAMRSLPRELEALLTEVSGDQLRRRPAPGEWSILEVCCHLRDAARIEHGRISLMASADDPAIEPYDEAALAREGRYNEDSIVAVRRDLDAAWGSLKALFEELPDDAWQRTGRPSGERRRHDRRPGAAAGGAPAGALPADQRGAAPVKPAGDQSGDPPPFVAVTNS